MSLSRASGPNGDPISLPGALPYPCDALRPLVGVPFSLPCDDPWLRKSGTTSHAYLDAAREAWDTDPAWMDFLDFSSPASAVKRAGRDLYLHHWAPWLDAKRVLDVGAGIGRLALPLLDRGANVWAVDPDLKSLQRLAWRAPGRPGRLDLHWSSANVLPDVEGIDLAIACEVLCYLPDALGAVEAMAERLRPGGVLVLSVEAQWAWAASADAPADALAAALDDDMVVDLPGERWVRTYDIASVEALVAEAGLEPLMVEPTHYVVDGPLEPVLPDDVYLEQILDAETQCRAHPIWAPLNRIWTAAAIKPK